MDPDASWPNASNTNIAPSLKNVPPRKLRDSCASCAGSKIKCTKEKPSCSRCVRRGLQCNYPASRRIGRTSMAKLASAAEAAKTARSEIPRPNPSKSQDQGKDDSNEAPSHASPCDQGMQGDQSIQGDQTMQVDQNIQGSQDVQHLQALTPCSSLDALCPPHPLSPDVWRPTPTPATPTGSPSFMADFSHLFTPVFPTAPEHTDISASAVNATAAASDSALDPSSLSERHSADAFLHSQSFLLGDLSGLESPFSSASSSMLYPRSCLRSALDMLTQLFPNTAATCIQPGTDLFGTSKTVTIESVVAENKLIVDAIERMLKCPCSQDEYLVTVLSLVVLKALAWYAAAAGDRTLTDRDILSTNAFAPPFLADNTFSAKRLGCIADNNPRSRVAAQRVLSELHRVQRLLNSLSERFETIRLRSCIESSGTSVSTTPGIGNGSSSSSSRSSSSSSSSGGGSGTSPLSAPTFSQLEVDLRKRLRAVSSEIIETLRRE